MNILTQTLHMVLTMGKDYTKWTILLLAGLALFGSLSYWNVELILQDNPITTMVFPTMTQKITYFLGLWLASSLTVVTACGMLILGVLAWGDNKLQQIAREYHQS